MYINLGVLLVFLRHLYGKQVLVTKGLVEECDNKSVLRHYQDLGRVKFIYRFTLVFQLLDSLLDNILQTVIRA